MNDKMTRWNMNNTFEFKTNSLRANIRWGGYLQCLILIMTTGSCWIFTNVTRRGENSEQHRRSPMTEWVWGAAMRGCYESGSRLDPVCSPLSRISFCVPRFLSLSLPVPAFSSYSCTRCMFGDMIDGVEALVLWVLRGRSLFHLSPLPSCLIWILLLCCMFF